MRHENQDRDTAHLAQVELETLCEISKLIGSALELDRTLAHVLEILADKLRMERATIVLYDSRSGALRIRASCGLTPEQERRGIYRVSEGVCGRIFTTCTPFVVKDVDSEPLFLDRTGARRDISSRMPGRGTISFIGVPIVVNHRAVGVLTADRLFDDPVSFREDVSFLSTVATLIGQFLMLNDAVEVRHAGLVQENRDLKAELTMREHFPGIIGSSPALRENFRIIEKVAPCDATVLILGESGTGKELIARAIHSRSNRTNGPFVKINCAALPENLLESELFGHERGAFTGAVARRAGRFELAHTGTIFLDEVGELPLSIQAKLLRVIQEKEFERLGGAQTIKVDVRIIAATNRDLAQEAKDGTFRQDLFYRLNVVPITMPPLRQRMEDLPLLAEYFVTQACKRHGKSVALDQAAMAVLRQYHWPGNVRELENLMEQLVILADGPVIGPEALPGHIRRLAPDEDSKSPRGWGENSLSSTQLEASQVQGIQPSLETTTSRRPLTLKEMEKREILAALERNDWIQARAARELGLTQRQIGYKIRKYGLRPGGKA